MFISRPSDPRTVLLWGDRWWFAGTGTSKPFGDATEAVELLAAHFSEEPKPVRLRLIYQPDTLKTVAVACPQGDRATLAAALSGEFPALRSPDQAWSHEPVLPVRDDFSTLLHFETEPGLIALATTLAQRGLAIDSVWPLATLLPWLAGDWSETGAVTVVAAQADRAVAYHHPSDGVRSVMQWHGASTLAEVGAWLNKLFAKNADEPVLLVCVDDATLTEFGTFVGEGHPGVEQCRMNEAIGRAGALPRYHPAQLLPRLPQLTTQRFLIAASIAFSLTAGWLGATYVRGEREHRVQLQAERARLIALRSEVAHLRANVAEIASLRRSLDSGAAGAPVGELLERIAVTIPSQATVSALRTTAQTWSINGWVPPKTGPKILDDWRAQLTSNHAPWTAEVSQGVNGSFHMTGGFRS